MLDCWFKVCEDELSYSKGMDTGIGSFNDIFSHKEFVFGAFRKIATFLIFNPVSGTVALASGCVTPLRPAGGVLTCSDHSYQRGQSSIASKWI